MKNIHTHVLGTCKVDFDDPRVVYESVYSFYNDEEDVIVFGCAGLKTITGEITSVKSLGLYLFGEICMAKDQAVFGNLMLSKLRLRKVK